MSGDFEDIAIVDLDVAKTTWSRVHSSMRTVYLKLSREPEVGWTRHFFEERAKRINPKRHGLWIEDGYVVVDCFVDEVEKFHLPDIRLSIAYANRKSREQLDRRREESREARDDAREEQLELAALRERIRGAAPAPPAGATQPEDVDAEWASRRNDWQARFRAALKSSKKEPRRGND